jgi:antirestriction protein ArdC
MSVYDAVTEQILKELEAGTPPWTQSWQPRLPKNLISQKEYRGINVLLLWTVACKKNYRNPYWLTFKQAGDCKGKIKKGEKATWIVYAAKVKKEDEKGEEHEYSFLKWYYVFNLEQTEGIPIAATPVKPIEEVEAFTEAIEANVIHGNTRAYYLPKFDQIHLPDPEDFKTMADYYMVSLHEHTHWTGHESRLNRPLVNRFGSEEYAEEELVAELGSAFLCSHLGVPSRLREDHAAYIKSWIRILKEDRRAIFTAAGKATKAAEYLRSFSRQEAASHE